MTKPYSLDLRERVTERVAAGDHAYPSPCDRGRAGLSLHRFAQHIRRFGSMGAPLRSVFRVVGWNYLHQRTTLAAFFRLRDAVVMRR